MLQATQALCSGKELISKSHILLNQHTLALPILNYFRKMYKLKNWIMQKVPSEMVTRRQIDSMLSLYILDI